jgi:tRNA pseudouridine(38-40) synthase
MDDNRQPAAETHPVPQNWRLTLAYDGTGFKGWQVQPGELTIQGELQSALHRVIGESPLPQGSGRTDAGVHALGQVASFTLHADIPAENLQRALNRTLSSSIRVLEARTVRSTFHARHSAIAKTYEYRVFQDTICPPFLARYVHACPWPMDLEALQAAAATFLGEHDFLSFAATYGRSRKTHILMHLLRSKAPSAPSTPRLGNASLPMGGHSSFTASAATASCTTWSATWWEPCSMQAAAARPSRQSPPCWQHAREPPPDLPLLRKACSCTLWNTKPIPTAKTYSVRAASTRALRAGPHLRLLPLRPLLWHS